MCEGGGKADWVGGGNRPCLEGIIHRRAGGQGWLSRGQGQRTATEDGAMVGKEFGFIHDGDYSRGLFTTACYSRIHVIDSPAVTRVSQQRGRVQYLSC